MNNNDTIYPDIKSLANLLKAVKLYNAQLVKSLNQNSVSMEAFEGYYAYFDKLKAIGDINLIKPLGEALCNVKVVCKDTVEEGRLTGYMKMLDNFMETVYGGR